MNTYRKALPICVLMLTLAASAFAGEIQHPIALPDPTTNRETASTASASTSETDIATGMALNLLQSLLSLL